MAKTDKLIRLGGWLFLGAVALLIVRNNSYAWPVKRASDILLLLSFLSAAWFIVRKKDYKFLEVARQKKIFLWMGFMAAGLAAAGLSGYFFYGTSINRDGFLEIGRFAEVFAILLLVGFFQNYDANFYKKIAIAQLSTAAYLVALFAPIIFLAMYRFQLFENWPSNVGYYLIVSLGLIFALLLEYRRRLKWAVPLYLLAVGYTAIALWAQSRASWLGVFAAIVFMIIIWAEKSWRKILGGLALAATLPVLGFIILPNFIQNNALSRFAPGIYGKISPVSTPSGATIRKIYENPAELRLIDQRRIYLWTAYAKKILLNPLGIGPTYDPAKIISVGAPQGPHNTPLEILTLTGLAGLMGFLGLFIFGLKNSYQKIKTAVRVDRFWPTYVLAALIGLFVAAFFDDMSTFRVMWLMLGMAVFL